MLASLIALTLAGPGDDVVYTSERAFRIPLEMNDNERRQAAAVRLMVSTDQGKTWSMVRNESPRRPTITFRAPADGLYWLALAIVGHDERQRPANPADLKPGLKVLVDSQRPDVALEAVRTRSGLRGVRWTVTDTAAESQLKLQAAVWDQETKRWKPRGLVECKNKTLWFDRQERIGKMQLWAVDPAGNETVTQISIDGDRFLCSDEKAFVFADRAPTPEEFVAANAPERKPAGEREEPNLLLAQADAEPLAKPVGKASPVTKAAAPPVEEAVAEEPAPPKKTARPAPVTEDAVAHDVEPTPLPKKAAPPVAKRPAPTLPPEEESEPVVEPPKASKKAVKPAPPPPVEESEPVADEPPPRMEKSKAKKPTPAVEETISDEPIDEPAPQTRTRPAPKRPTIPMDDSVEQEPIRSEKAATAKPAPRETPAVEATYTNRRTVLLHYEMDAEPTDLVTLWGTMDDGQTWKLLGRDNDEKSPLEATFPRSGRWGIRLEIPGDQGEGRPQAGDPPSSYVEVDTRKPVLSLEQPSYERDWVRIAWSAEDANLADDSVRVSFSLRPDGPWKTIVAQQPTAGEYIWKPSDEAAAVPVFVKVDALDMAGNIGSTVARKAIQRGVRATAASKTAEPTEAEAEAPKPAPRKTKAAAKRAAPPPTDDEEVERPAPRPAAKKRAKPAPDAEELVLPDDR